MTDNEMQTVDLVVGPLETFDDAVAFGDALYGLEGVTRLALNEFEGNRACFTFSARSLNAVSESLSRLPEFPVGSVEQAVDGTLQVRLGGGNPVQLAEPEVAEAPQPAPIVDPLPDPLPQVATAPTNDPFARAGEFPPDKAFDQAWSSQPAGADVPPTPAGEFPQGNAFDQGWSPEVAPADMPSTAFDQQPQGEMTATPQAPAEEQPVISSEPLETSEQYPSPAAGGWPEETAPAVSHEEPTPLFPGIEADNPAPQVSEDAGAEVARVIDKLAAELRETAEHLARLAAGLAPTESASEPDPDEPVAPWQPPAVVDPSEVTWDGDVPSGHGGSDQYAAPPVLTPQELDAIAATESWAAPEQDAGQQWAEQQDAVVSADSAEEPEPKGWEAPRMPSVGAMAPMPGDTSSPEFKSEAHNAQAIALATAMGRRPSQVQLMASGFASFGIANSFIAAVRQIAGVRNVAIVELDQGRLKLTLDYFGSEGLESQLQQLREFPHQVVKASGKEIEIQLMAA